MVSLLVDFLMKIKDLVDNWLKLNCGIQLLHLWKSKSWENVSNHQLDLKIVLWPGVQEHGNITKWSHWKTFHWMNFVKKIIQTYSFGQKELPSIVWNIFVEYLMVKLIIFTPKLDSITGIIYTFCIIFRCGTYNSWIN